MIESDKINNSFENSLLPVEDNDQITTVKGIKINQLNR